MPSIRKRMYGLIRTLSSPNASEGDEPTIPAVPEEAPRIPLPPDEEQSFIFLYLTGRLRRAGSPEIWYGKTGVDLPRLQLRCPLSSAVVAASSGPDGGLETVPPVRKVSIAAIANLDEELSISMDADSMLDLHAASTTPLHPAALYLDCANHAFEFVDNRFDWESGNSRAWGASTSLYEENPLTRVRAGTPIADVFGILAREDSAILALADGVNWGDRARLAARCAIRGAMDHLNDALFQCPEGEGPKSTLDIFHALLGAFHAGHQLILQEEGMLTTLCVAVVVPLAGTTDWVVCTCNVGDSLCFVYNAAAGVREITLGSHDIREMRDMRDAGGALGPVDGVNPELQNLTCSMSVVQEGDLVFITSDGVSDNFDPVVGKFCVMKPPKAPMPPPPPPRNVPGMPPHPPPKATPISPLLERQKSEPPLPAGKEPPMANGQKPAARTPSLDLSAGLGVGGLPAVEATQRHELMLLRMEDLLRHGVTIGDAAAATAPALVHALINFATQLSSAKRRTLEDPDLYQGDPKLKRMDQKQRRRLVRQKMIDMPGKLDHATVVAYSVGKFSAKQALDERSQSSPSPSEPVPVPLSNGDGDDGGDRTPTPTRKVLLTSTRVEAGFAAAPAQSEARLELQDPAPYVELFVSMKAVLEKRQSEASLPEPREEDIPVPRMMPVSPREIVVPQTIVTPRELVTPTTEEKDDSSPRASLAVGDSDSITLSEDSSAVEEVSLDVDIVAAPQDESATTFISVPSLAQLQDAVPMIDDDEMSSGLPPTDLDDVEEVVEYDDEASEDYGGQDTKDDEDSELIAIPEAAEPLPSSSCTLRSNGHVTGGPPRPSSLRTRDSLISSEPSPSSEPPDPDIPRCSPELASGDSDVSVRADFECSLRGYLEEAPAAVAIFPNSKETATAILNSSYLKATADDVLIPRPAPHSPLSVTLSTPPLSSPIDVHKKKSMPLRTLERLEKSLTKRKHRRTSPSRHTVAVDGNWLHKLGLGGSRKGSATGSREGTPTKEQRPPPKGRLGPLRSVGGTLRSRLGMGGSPEKEAAEAAVVPQSMSQSTSDHSGFGAATARPDQLFLGQPLGAPNDFRSPDTLL